MRCVRVRNFGVDVEPDECMKSAGVSSPGVLTEGINSHVRPSSGNRSENSGILSTERCLPDCAMSSTTAFAAFCVDCPLLTNICLMGVCRMSFEMPDVEMYGAMGKGWIPALSKPIKKHW